MILGFLLFIFSSIASAENSLATEILNSEISNAVVKGDEASINWVLLMVASFCATGLVYITSQYISLLKTRAEENKEGWVLLDNAKSVLKDANSVMREVLDALRKLDN